MFGQSVSNEVLVLVFDVLLLSVWISNETLSCVWSFYVEWSTLPRVWCITFWCLNIRWNTLYRVWYVTCNVLISDETLLLVFDALLLGVWTSNKTLLFVLIRYPGILCQIQNSFSCLVYSFLVFGHKMNHCFSCLLDILIFWYQVKHSFLCLIYRLIYKQNRNSFDDGKAREKD